MKRKLIPHQRFTAIYSIFAILVVSFSYVSYSPAAQGQSKQPTNNTDSPDGSSRGRPTRRRGTGSRNGECQSLKNTSQSLGCIQRF